MIEYYSTVYNIEETAVMNAITPIHQYVPINQCRASSVAGTSENEELQHDISKCKWRIYTTLPDFKAFK